MEILWKSCFLLLGSTFDPPIYLGSLCRKSLSRTLLFVLPLDASKKKSFELKRFSFTIWKDFYSSYIIVLHLNSPVQVKVSRYLGFSNAICKANVLHPVLSSAHRTLRIQSGTLRFQCFRGAVGKDSAYIQIYPISSAIYNWSHVWFQFSCTLDLGGLFFFFFNFVSVLVRKALLAFQHKICFFCVYRI